MRIARCHIDGFGVFRDHAIDDLGSGLCVLLGPNEAGKTTLLHFLRWMLFGHHKSLVPPLCGGSEGGRLWLDTPVGVYRLNRRPSSAQKTQAVLTRPDETSGDEVELRALLGHADRSTFESVFAFDQFELQAFHDLDRDQIRQRLFSAGISGAGQQAMTAMTQLAASRDKLLSQRKGQIRDLLKSLAEKQLELDRACDQALGFAAAQARVQALAAEIQQMTAQAQTLRAQASDLDHLLDLWPTWLELERCNQDLAELEPEPPQFLEITTLFDQGTRALTERTEQIRQISEKLGPARQAVERLVPSPTLGELAVETKALSATMALYEQNGKDLASFGADQKRKEQELAAILGDLGPDWSTARVKSLDRSLMVREGVRGWQERLDAANARSDSAKARLETAQVNKSAALRSLQDVQENQAKAPDAPSAEALSALQQHLQELRAGLEERNSQIPLAQAAQQAALDAQAADAERLQAEETLDRLGQPIALGVLDQKSQELHKDRLALRRARSRLAEVIRQSERVEFARQNARTAESRKAARGHSLPPRWLGGAVFLLGLLVMGWLALPWARQETPLASEIRAILLGMAALECLAAVWLAVLRVRARHDAADLDRTVSECQAELQIHEAELDRLRALLAADLEPLGCAKDPDFAILDGIESELDQKATWIEENRRTMARFDLAREEVEKTRRRLASLLLNRGFAVDLTDARPGLAQVVELAGASARDWQAALTAREQDLAHRAHSLGLPSAPRPHDLEQAFARLAQDQQRRNHIDALKTELSDCAERLLETEDREQEAQKLLKIQLATAAELADEWLAWKTNRGLPEDLGCRGVLELFDCLERAHGALEDLDDLAQRRQLLTQSMERFRARAEEILQAAGQPVPHSEDRLAESIRQVLERIEADQALRTERAKAQALLEQLETQIKEHERAAADLRDKGIALLARVDLTEASQFERLRQNIARRRELENQRNQIEELVATRIGRDAHAIELRAELATGEKTEWEALKQQIAQQAEEIAQGLLERAGDLREAENSRDEVARSADVPRLEMERNSLVRHLEESRQRYVVLGLAHGLIASTLRRFEQERQPAVLQAASRLFAPVTQGVYVGLHQEGEALVASDRAGRTHDPAYFSTGTRQQLYICLRLALADNLAQNGIELPVVMDDVFVNCDPERAHNLAAVVAEFATQHQVLVFTCHPQTADLLVESAPGTTVLRLGRQAATDEPRTVPGRSSVVQETLPFIPAH